MASHFTTANEDEKEKSIPKASSNGSNGIQPMKKKLQLTLKSKSSYTSNSDDEESGTDSGSEGEDDEEIRGAQAHDDNNADITAPQPRRSSRVAAALEALAESQVIDLTVDSAFATATPNQPSSQFTSVPSPHKRQKKTATLVLRASYQPGTDSDNDGEFEYEFNAGFDELVLQNLANQASGPTNDDAGDNSDDGSEPYHVQQECSAPHNATACNGCCNTQDEVTPSIEKPGMPDREAAIHDAVEFIYEMEYSVDDESEQHVRFTMGVFTHIANCCEPDCHHLSGTFDMDAQTTYYAGSVASVFPPNQTNASTAYLISDDSDWMEMDLDAKVDEVEWITHPNREQEMVEPKAWELFETQKEKAVEAIKNWARQASDGVVVFVDGRQVKVFVVITGMESEIVEREVVESEAERSESEGFMEVKEIVVKTEGPESSLQGSVESEVMSVEEVIEARIGAVKRKRVVEEDDEEVVEGRRRHEDIREHIANYHAELEATLASVNSRRKSGRKV